MQHSDHTPLAAEELNTANLDGVNVYGPDDKNIGSISHFHGAGSNATVVVDVGGFLGLGAKPVALGMSEMNFMRAPDGTVHATTSMTKDQLKDLPEHHH